MSLSYGDLMESGHADVGYRDRWRRETGAGMVRGESPRRQEVGHETPALVSRRRVRRYRPRPTEWVKVGRRKLATTLAALDDATERVYTTAAPAGADRFRRWALAAAPAGWSAGAHFLDDIASPVLRFTRPDGRPVDVYGGGAWFGDDAVDSVDAAAALEVVDGELRRVFGSGVLATPATTGREMFARSIPTGAAWPVLSDEHQELIRSTTGQGRIEICPTVDRLERLVELDGRLMYGALCWSLGGGPARHDRGSEFLGYRPARYRVDVTVPDSWDHVGLLPLMGEGRLDGWSYPSAPGARFSTWIDGAEFHLAAKYGWRLEIRERLVFDDDSSKPLDRWAASLCAIAAAHDDQPLVRAAVRAILLHAIGAFAGRPRLVTHSCDASESGRVPSDVRDVRKVGETLIWQQHEPAAWPEMSHPEWSARVWARARVRLLDGPGPTGALHMPRPTVIGFLTDAIYATSDPRWSDDGKPGRFRVKSSRSFTPAPAPAPAKLQQLIAMRDA